MRVQKSFSEQQASSSVRAGTLYLVATPIGNLEDITLRALRTLREVDLIAAEDTRHTRKLLAFYEIHTKLKSYHEHNKVESGSFLVDFLKKGMSIALVSDAGMPAISDPGYELVKSAVAEELRVVPIPGANAALSALIISGLATDQFTFVGFLPREKKALRSALSELHHHRQTMIFYESPHRLKQTLKMMSEQWASREVAIVRELTKKYEEVVRGVLSDCYAHVEEHGAIGEYCIVIAGEPAIEREAVHQNVAQPLSALAIMTEVSQLIEQGYQEKEAIKSVAKLHGVAKRDIYNEYVRMKKTSDD
jgi:16S rRNA (cytidine1402-2'-O)-methyltransferase